MLFSTSQLVFPIPALGTLPNKYNLLELARMVNQVDETKQDYLIEST
jgi:hypothetical protein